mmetsp:Transcript_30818/g.73226  ORF Transcript_30818/g.73226 Transcript_30818/m.73226 type:complete len:496 (-) Transcript_30818:102-1589(-)
MPEGGKKEAGVAAKPMLSDEELVEKLERLKVAQPDWRKKQLLEGLRAEGLTISEKRLARVLLTQGNGTASYDEGDDPEPAMLQAIATGCQTFEKRHQVQKEHEGKQTKVRPAPDIYGRTWHRPNIKIDWTDEVRRCKALEQKGEVNAALRRATQVRRIGGHDTRVGLRGQKGLYARQRIGIGTVFPLCCRVALLSEYQTLFANAEDRAEHDRYALQLTTGRDWDEGPLMADLLSDGNALHFINDPIGSDTPANCEFVEVLSRGWPLLFAVVVEPIEEGQELLLNYGEGYWTNVACHHMRLGNYEVAGNLGRAVLEAQIAKIGSENRSVASTLEMIADAHEQLGQLNEAVDVHEQNLALRIRLVGEDHILSVIIQERLARIRHAQGLVPEARDLYATVVAFKFQAIPYIPESNRAQHLFGLASNLQAVACLHARCGEEDQCHQALHAIAQMPSEISTLFRTNVEQDSELDTVREAEWFPSILAAFPAPLPEVAKSS